MEQIIVQVQIVLRSSFRFSAANKTVVLDWDRYSVTFMRFYAPFIVLL